MSHTKWIIIKIITTTTNNNNNKNNNQNHHHKYVFFKLASFKIPKITSERGDFFFILNQLIKRCITHQMVYFLREGNRYLISWPDTTLYSSLWQSFSNLGQIHGHSTLLFILKHHKESLQKGQDARACTHTHIQIVDMFPYKNIAHTHIISVT